MTGRAMHTRCIRKRERGSVVVEAAIILPLLMMLTFGTIEFGLAFRDSASIASATRSGARIGSAMPAQVGFQDRARMSVNDALKDLTHSTPLKLVIFKADPNTGMPVSGTYTSCDYCYRYSWDNAAKAFPAITDAGSGIPWTADDQKADLCAGTTDAIGVYVQARHDFITGLFGSFATYDHKTVMLLEPIDPQLCSP